MQPELNLSPVETGQVLLLVDWDNFWYSLFTRFGIGKMNIEDRIRALMGWVKTIGGLWGGHGFVFAPEHLTSIHREICVNNGLWLVTCPKKQLTEPRRNRKSGRMETKADTVDETLVNFAKMLTGHPRFKTLCLVSGDNDFVALFQFMHERGVKTALAAPTVNSLARTQELIKLVDEYSFKHGKMLLMLDNI